MRRIFRGLGWLIRQVLCLPRYLLMLPILLYRRIFSPMKGCPCCRFTPTCSRYALDAIRQWGAIIGLVLSVWRILRCQPFCRGGYDPVPTPPWKKKRAVDAHDGSDTDVGAP